MRSLFQKRVFDRYFSTIAFLAAGISLLLANIGAAQTGNDVPAARPPTNVSLLVDDFRDDASLKSTLWTINGSAASEALKHFDSPTASIIAPTITFTPSGLGLGTSNATFQQTGIQTADTFTPPFIVTAEAEATSIEAGVIQLLICSEDGGSGVSIVGGDGASSVFTGFWYGAPSGPGTHWEKAGKFSDSIPSLNTVYTLLISVDGSGEATASLWLGGHQIGSPGIARVGSGPFYVVIAQGAGAFSSGRPNQAYWRSIRVATP